MILTTSSVLDYYIALSRPRFEYASVICSPEQTVFKQLIKRVQHRFFRFAFCEQLLTSVNFDAASRSFRFTCTFIPISYTSRFLISDPITRICYKLISRVSQFIFIFLIPPYHIFNASKEIWLCYVYDTFMSVAKELQSSGNSN